MSQSQSKPLRTNYLKRLWLTMSWNVVWYAVYALWILFHYVIPTAISVFHNLGWIYKYSTWEIFISPAAYIFLSLSIGSIFFPIQCLFLIPGYFDKTVEQLFRRRYLWTLLTFIGLPVAMAVIGFILWGSCPLDVDKDSFIHLRFIPFFPWPSEPFFT